MSDPVEPPDLDAIRERCGAATPGPWHAVEANRMSSRVQWDVEEAADLEALAGCWWGDAEANAKFIAHAREDVPALAAALVAALSERDRFREHSVTLNTVGWRISEALGNVPEGATEVWGDTLPNLEALIQDRDEARERVRQFVDASEMARDALMSGSTPSMRLGAESALRLAEKGVRSQEVILGALRDGTVDSREHTLALRERAETAERMLETSESLRQDYDIEARELTVERDRLREALQWYADSSGVAHAVLAATSPDSPEEPNP